MSDTNQSDDLGKKWASNEYSTFDGKQQILTFQFTQASPTGCKVNSPDTIAKALLSFEPGITFKRFISVELSITTINK